MRFFFRWLAGAFVCLAALCWQAAAVPDVSINDFSSPEGTGGTNRMRFVVTINETSDAPVYVNFATSNGTAIAGLDFSNTVGSVMVPAGALAATGQVRSATDSVFENDETFEVHIFAATNGVIVDSFAIGTILNDDPAPVLTFAGSTNTEGSGGTTLIPFVFTLNVTSILETSFGFATSNGTAVAGEDYVATSGVAIIASGQLSATVQVEVVTDSLFEGDQTFTFNVFDASNVVFGVTNVTVQISEDDTPPVASIAATYSQTEGSAGENIFIVPVTLSTSVQADVAVNFATAFGSADGTDFSPTNGTLLIPAGSATGIVAVTVEGDTDFEPSESFTITISAPSNAMLGVTDTSVMILNDDTAADVSIADVALNEGTGGTGSIQVAVSLSQAPPVNVSINFATVADTATAASDFLATNGTLVIAAGQTGAFINVRIVRDAAVEPDETFSIVLSNPTNVAIFDSVATITLLNDDSSSTGAVIPIVSVGDVTNYEGTGGTNIFGFVLSLSETTDVGVAVSYVTSNGTAVAGEDYVTTNGSIVFPAGTLTATVGVRVVTESFFENTESFTLNLSAPVNATIGDGNGSGIILDDDEAPIASIVTNFVQAEGTGVTNNFLVPVVLSTNAGADVFVSFSMSPETAIANEDYEHGSGTATIPAGSLTGFVAIAVYGDDVFEFAETFRIILSSASNATVGVNECLVTITNDDSGADISIDDITQPEGSSGGPTALVIRVALSQPVITDLSVNFATAPGTANAGSDFTPTNGLLIIPSGQTNAFITVLTSSDAAFEEDEAFTVNLSNATNGTIVDAQAVITLQNDDDAPSVSVGGSAQGEGNEGTTELIVPVTLSAASIVPISVNYETSNGTATAGTDYIASSGTLLIEPGTISTSFVVTLLGDVDQEGDETFFVTLSSPTNAMLGTNSAIAVIVDDENPPTLAVGGVTNLEGSTGTTQFLIPVTLSTTMIINVSVSFSASNGSAVAGTDFIATNGLLTIPAGTRTGFVAIAVIGDTDYEAAEAFSVHLSSPVNAKITVTNAASTILNDDIPPVISVSSATRGEGTGDQVDMEFPISLNVAVSTPVTVYWVTSNGTAIAGSDYSGGTGTATIVAGQTTGAVYIAIAGDSVFEGSETFTLHLIGATNATVGTGNATGTIIDDETPPSATIANVSSTEGSGGGTTNVLVPVVLSTGVGIPVSINFQSLEITAGEGPDYTGTNGTLVIPANVRTGFVSIAVLRDNVQEGDETFAVQLFGPTNVTLASTQGVVTIVNDDGPPTISIGSVTQIEGDSGTSEFVFPVTLSTAAGFPVTVEYFTSNGTATAGTDYTATSGSLLIPAGDTATSITVSVSGDNNPEGDETFTVRLFAPTNATITSSVATGTIVEDEADPDLFIGSVTQIEGNAGTTLVQLAVTMSTSSFANVTVQFASSNGTALAGVDYLATNGLLTIPAGSRTGVISVAIIGDAAFEFTDTLYVTLSNAINANIVAANGTVTVVNDDTMPVVSVNPASRTEGNIDTLEMIVPVTLSSPAGVDVYVDHATSNGSAVAGSDYMANSGLVFIPAGETNSSVFITIFGDTAGEGDETFIINIFSPSNATIGTSSAVMTIIDDEPLPFLTVGSISVIEGNSGSVTTRVPVILSATSAVNVTVAFATSNEAALAGNDYIATNGTLTIPPGSRTGLVEVVHNSDTTFETNELFTLNLFNATASAITNAIGIVSVLNDDAAPALSVSDVTQAEGDSGTTEFTFSVSLNSTAGAPISVSFITSNGTATASSDYDANAGTLLIPEGQSSTTVVVIVNSDSISESDESFTLNLFAPVNASIDDASGLGTIQNDDGVPSITIADVSLLEANSGSTSFTFPLTLNAPAGGPISVGYVTSNGTATAGADFNGATGTLLIAAGQATTGITISVIGETTYESNETFTLHLTSASGATIATNLATGTILNDDAPPGAIATGSSVIEGNTTPTNINFVITLNRASDFESTVAYSTSNGTATAGSDYEPTTGIVTFAAGQTSATVSVNVLAEALFEANETLSLNLHSPEGATTAVATATGTILNDDTAPSLTLLPYGQDEGSGGLTTFNVPVSLSSAAGLPVSVTYVTTNGTALAGSDYTAITNTITIPAGDPGGLLSISVNADTNNEPHETFSVRLSAPVNATLATTQALVTIFNDDTPVPAITISNLAFTEGSGGGSTNLIIPVVLSFAVATPVSLNFQTSDDTALAPSDYTFTNGTLTIPANTQTGFISIAITSDDLLEVDETFNLMLSDPAGATIAAGTAAITILNDDTASPGLSIATNIVRAEGNGGGITNFLIPVILSAAIGNPVTVDFQSLENTALESSDYAATNGTLTIPANTRTSFIAVAVSRDNVFEPDENFTILITNAINAVLVETQALVTIANDDAPPAITIANASAPENGGELVFAVTLSYPPPFPVSVEFTTSNGTATAGDDYAGNAGTLTFAIGQTNTTITLSIFDDTSLEIDETFSVNLFAPTNATLAVAQGTGTILDNEPKPDLTLGDLTLPEGSGGPTSIRIPVTLSEPYPGTITLQFSTSNETALAGSDYTATNGTLTIPPNTLTAAIAITISGDLSYENAETFRLDLSNAANASLSIPGITITLDNDDALPVLRIPAYADAEGNSGTTDFNVPVTLTPVSGVDVTFDWNIVGGTATAGDDYSMNGGQLTIPAGTTSTTFTITINGDTTIEDSETIHVSLDNPVNATVTNNPGIITILADDAHPVLLVTDHAQPEGSDGGLTTFTIQLTLNTSGELPATFTYTTSGGTALAGTDFISLTNTHTILAGQTTADLTISVHADTNHEPDEVFTIHLTSPTNLTFSTNQILVTIQNDDELPPPTGYDAWKLNIAIEEDRDYTDDPDADGHPNLLEYILGTDPNIPDETSAIGSTLTNGLHALTFTRDSNATDATLIIEAANILTNASPWTAIATNLLGSWGSSTNITETTGTNFPTALDVSAPGTNCFLRLRVTRP